MALLYSRLINKIIIHWSYSSIAVGYSLALRISGLTVPERVWIGADALLQCHYDLEGRNLYALKWYKGSHEFYSYVPKEMPSIRVFPWSQFLIHAVSYSSSPMLLATLVPLVAPPPLSAPPPTPIPQHDRFIAADQKAV